jgi:hypothetical protein
VILKPVLKYIFVVIFIFIGGVYTVFFALGKSEKFKLYFLSVNSSFGRALMRESLAHLEQLESDGRFVELIGKLKSQDICAVTNGLTRGLSIKQRAYRLCSSSEWIEFPSDNLLDEPIAVEKGFGAYRLYGPKENYRSSSDQTLSLLETIGFRIGRYRLQLFNDDQVSFESMKFTSKEIENEPMCQEFRPNRESLQSAIQSYRVLTQEEVGQNYIWLSCYISGRILREGKEFYFRLRPGNLLETNFPDSQDRIWGGAKTDG